MRMGVRNMGDDIDYRIKQGERLAKIESHQEAHNGKLDNIQTTMDKLSTGIGSRVELHGREIEGLQTSQTSHKEHLEAVNEKINKHVDGHWKWITIVISLIAIGTFLLKAWRP